MLQLPDVVAPLGEPSEFQQLLKKPRRAMASAFEKLLQRPLKTEFEKLLERPLGRTVRELATTEKFSISKMLPRFTRALGVAGGAIAAPLEGLLLGLTPSELGDAELPLKYSPVRLEPRTQLDEVPIRAQPYEMLGYVGDLYAPAPADLARQLGESTSRSRVGRATPRSVARQSTAVGSPFVREREARSPLLSRPMSRPIPRPIPRRQTWPELSRSPVLESASAPPLGFSGTGSPLPSSSPLPSPLPSSLSLSGPTTNGRDCTCKTEKRPKRPSDKVPTVRSYKRRMSEYSLENLNRGRKPGRSQ